MYCPAARLRARMWYLLERLVKGVAKIVSDSIFSRLGLAQAASTHSLLITLAYIPFLSSQLALINA